VEVLGRGLPEGWVGEQLADVDGVAATEGATIAVDALAFRVTRPASWAKPGSPFVVVADELSVVFQRNNLVAIHCPPSQVDALQRWLDGDPRPAFRRVRGAYLQQAFLRGEARGLWLKGTHRRQTAKADTKNLSGPSLGEALNPLDDGSFALTSGRAATEGPAFVVVEGTVGTTPRKSWVWNGRTTSLRSFILVANELLGIVLDLFANPPSNLPFPELAVEIDSLTEVRAAYDAYVAEPEELRQLPDVSDDTIDAAETLRDTFIDIVGDPAGPNFTIVVGQAGIEVGRLRCQPKVDRHQVSIDINLAGTPTDPASTAYIRDALSSSTDLLTVHYQSGHHLGRGILTRVNQAHHPFKGWQFVDYTGFDCRQEKPAAVAGPQAIHDAIGGSNDTSLFAWVIHHLGSGHLTCDDGANEVADFIHVANDGSLTLVHVKAASSSASHRVSTGAFELVVNQAVKNLKFATNADRLISALEDPPIDRPASWIDGARVADRSGLIDALRLRTSSDEVRVAIVQPHHTKTMHDSVLLTAAAGGSSQDLTRFELVETMLTSARASAVGLGGELSVWARL
jgi:hypothetical protein